MGDGLEVGGKVFRLPVSAGRSDRAARLERQAIYLAWLLQPKDAREPSTKKAMAEGMGVTYQTLLNYERDPDFTAELRRQLGHVFRTDRLPSVIDALYRTALEPENPRQVQAARTLLEWLGAVQGEGLSDLAEYTAEELEKLAEGG